MLTGDNTATAKAIADELGVDEVKADLMPAIADLQKEGHKVAMGGGGTQAALEAADIALMTDDLNKIVGARNIARRSYRTIEENLWVGVGVVHVLGITAALMGWIGPIEAAFIHLGPDVLVFLNSVKLLNVRIPGV